MPHGIDTIRKDEQKIHQLVRGRQPWPYGIDGYDVVFSEDSTGDASVWIWFHVPEEHEPSRAYLNKLRAFLESIRSELQGANLVHWPYVEFRASPKRRVRH